MNAASQTAVVTHSGKSAGWPGWLPLVALPGASIVLRSRFPAWAFMWALAFAIFAGLKWMTWWTARLRSRGGLRRSMAYLLLWPGMDADTFLEVGRKPEPPMAQEWAWAGLKTGFGVALLWALVRLIPAKWDLLRGWAGLLGLIFLLHFGSFHLLALFWQRMGIDAEPIMADPIRSKNLSEFWGKRWNLGFRQLAHEFVFRPLYKHIGVGCAGFLVFVISGLIHDLVISLPAQGGYGLPTAYFVLQGLGVAGERSAAGKRLRLQSGAVGRVFAIVLTVGPAFWLFHPLFLQRVVLPFLQAIHAL